MGSLAAGWRCRFLCWHHNRRLAQLIDVCEVPRSSRSQLGGDEVLEGDKWDGETLFFIDDAPLAIFPGLGECHAVDLVQDVYRDWWNAHREELALLDELVGPQLVHWSAKIAHRAERQDGISLSRLNENIQVFGCAGLRVLGYRISPTTRYFAL